MFAREERDKLPSRSGNGAKETSRFFFHKNCSSLNYDKMFLSKSLCCNRKRTAKTTSS